MGQKIKLLNPVARLYEILLKAHGNASNNRLKQPIKEIWGDVFDIPPTETPKLLKHVSALIDLTRRAKESVEALKEVNQEIYLKPFGNIEQALSIINLDAAWENFDRYLTEATFASLAFCADTVRRENYKDGTIDQDEIKEIQADIANVLEKVLESDIPQELKTVLIVNLEHIRDAIIQFRFHGIEGIKQALETNLGSILLNRELLKNSKDESVINKYFEIISRIENLVSIAASFQQLIAPILPLLMSGKSN